MSSYSNYLGAKKCCNANLAKTVTGPQGQKGAQGGLGPYGQQGSTGAQGLRGATGPCCRGPTGVPGVTGAQGTTGSQGATGNSLWIDMNDTGYTGIGVTGIDVLIYGNLLVTGAIDPTSLTLTEIGKPSSTYGLTGTGAYINTSSGSLLLEPTSKQVIVNDTILLDDGTTNTNTIDNTSTTISALGSFGTMTNATDKIGIEIKEDDGMGKYGKVELQRDNLYFTYEDPTAPSIPNFNIGLYANTGGGLCGIQHQDNSFTDKSNLTLSTNENLVFTADNIDMNATRLAFPSIASQIVASQNYLDYNTSGTNTSGRLFLNQGTTGGGANPILFINQNNTNDGAGVIRMFKNRSMNGSAIGELSFQAKTAEVGNPTKEYARIGTSIRNNATGNVDGSINLSARLNDVLTEFLRINGADGEVDIFRNLDMESNNILTDAKIGTRLAFPTGSYVDFANGSPDDYFRQDVNGIEYQFNDLTNVGTTILFNNYATAEQYFKQELITPTNTLTTIIENDLTHHRIKLEETLSGANTEITKDEIVIDDGTSASVKLSPSTLEYQTTAGATISNDGDIDITCVNTTGAGAVNINAGGNNDGTNVITLNAPYGNIDITSGIDINLSAPSGNILMSGITLQFNTINILPRRFNQSVSFSVNGSPTTTIFAVGAFAEMIAGTTWKVEVSFYTGAINTRNAITYWVLDTTPADVVQNSVFGYANGGIQTAIQFDPAGSPMGTYCSFVDTFDVSPSAVGNCNFILIGGTADGSTWSGSANVSIVLTRLL